MRDEVQGNGTPPAKELSEYERGRRDVEIERLKREIAEVEKRIEECKRANASSSLRGRRLPNIAAYPYEHTGGGGGGGVNYSSYSDATCTICQKPFHMNPMKCVSKRIQRFGTSDICQTCFIGETVEIPIYNAEPTPFIDLTGNYPVTRMEHDKIAVLRMSEADKYQFQQWGYCADIEMNIIKNTNSFRDVNKNILYRALDGKVTLSPVKVKNKKIDAYLIILNESLFTYSLRPSRNLAIYYGVILLQLNNEGHFYYQYVPQKKD